MTAIGRGKTGEEPIAEHLWHRRPADVMSVLGQVLSTRSPLPPSRTSGSPAPGSPVAGSLRHGLTEPDMGSPIGPLQGANPASDASATTLPARTLATLLRGAAVGPKKHAAGLGNRKVAKIVIFLRPLIGNLAYPGAAGRGSGIGFTARNGRGADRLPGSLVSIGVPWRKSRGRGRD